MHFAQAARRGASRCQHHARPSDDDDQQVVGLAPPAVPDREVHMPARLGTKLRRLPHERVVDAERVTPRQDLDRQPFPEEHLAEALAVERADNLARLLVARRGAVDREEGRREDRKPVLVDRCRQTTGPRVEEEVARHRRSTI